MTLILLPRVREKTACSHSLRFEEKDGRVTVYHDKRRKSVTLADYQSPDARVGWLSVLMDWIEEVHKA